MDTSLKRTYYKICKNLSSVSQPSKTTAQYTTIMQHCLFISRPSAQPHPQRTAQRLRSRQYTAQTSFQILWARIWKLVCAYPPPIHLSPKKRKKIARKPQEDRQIKDPRKKHFPAILNSSVKIITFNIENLGRNTWVWAVKKKSHQKNSTKN